MIISSEQDNTNSYITQIRTKIRSLILQISHESEVSKRIIIDSVIELAQMREIYPTIFNEVVNEIKAEQSNDNKGVN